MEKKVLIIYPFTNQTPLVFNMVANLRKNGILADAIDSKTFKFAIRPIERPTIRLNIFGFFWNLPIPFLKSLIFRIFSLEEELLKVASQYDIIDFHFLSKDYDNLIKKLHGRKIIKVALWGSDFYRADVNRRENQRKLLEIANCVQISTNAMRDDFLRYFQDFEEKIKIANFGLFQFDIISEILKTSYAPIFKVENYENKLMVVCGYNGSEGQQHLLIIDAIDQLDAAIKDKIFLVFPMTYGGGKSYSKVVEDRLATINVPFIILKTHLINNELAKLRIESDLVINIQKTDAFSGSLQEHLFAGSLLLVGEWLPYNILDENQIFYKKASLADLEDTIRDCIINIGTYKNMTAGNREKIHQISSWAVAGKRMSEIYKQL